MSRVDLGEKYFSSVGRLRMARISGGPSVGLAPAEASLQRAPGGGGGGLPPRELPKALLVEDALQTKPLPSPRWALGKGVSGCLGRPPQPWDGIG